MPNLQRFAYFSFFRDIVFSGRTRILARTPLFSRVWTTKSRNSVSSSIEMFPSIMITNKKKMRQRTLKRCKYLRFPSRVYFFADAILLRDLLPSRDLGIFFSLDQRIDLKITMDAFHS